MLHLLGAAVTRPNPLRSGEHATALRAYLLARYPDGLTTAFTPELGTAIGCSGPDGLALLSLNGRSYAVAGQRAAAAMLEDWISNWRAAGQPGFEQLRPVVERTAGGWRVRATL